MVLPLDELLQLRLRRHAVRLAYATVVPDTAPLLPISSKRCSSFWKVVRYTDAGPAGGVVASGAGERARVLQKATACGLRARGDRGREAVVFGGGGFRRGKSLATIPRMRREEVAYLDAGKGPYQVRMAREGDIIRPLGLGGTKKVFRAMMDRKVPSDLRRRTPVVVDGRDEVAWIVLGELDERYKVDERTEKVLRLEVERIS